MTQGLPAEPEKMHEHRGLVPACAAMMTAGFLTTFLSPLLATSFSDDFELGIEQAGLAVAAGTAGVAITALGILPFLPKLDRRKLGFIGALVAAAGLIATGFANGFVLVLVLQIVTGFGAGLCYAAANSALAFARLPERAFSIVTISWLLVGAGMLTLGPFMHSTWPKVGLFLGIAAVELICLAFIVRLPDVRLLPKDDLSPEQLEAEVEERSGAHHASGQTKHVPTWRSPGLILVLAILIMNIGNLTIWTFAESIGVKAGMSTEATSTFLGVSQLIGLVGAFITLMLGDKVPKMALLVPAVTLLALGNLAVGSASNPAPFIVGFLCINIAFFCISPLLLALAAELDSSSGRLVVIAGAVTLIAGAIAPALGGYIAGAEESWARLGLAAFGMTLISLPLLAGPVRSANKRARLEGELAEANAT